MAEITNADALFVFVKLANGENIICTTFSDIDKLDTLKFLEVIDPIQIFSFKIPQNGSIIEKYIMQSWTPFSSDSSSVVPINNVVFVGRLKDSFIEKYIDYITDPTAQQLLEESTAEEVAGNDDDDDSTVEEVIEEFINDDNNTKKWYH